MCAGYPSLSICPVTTLVSEPLFGSGPLFAPKMELVDVWGVWTETNLAIELIKGWFWYVLEYSSNFWCLDNPQTMILGEECSCTTSEEASRSQVF